MRLPRFAPLPQEFHQPLPSPTSRAYSDGAESSHMHDPWTLDMRRGYEGWLMENARARSPTISTYGLPWALPQWVSCNPGTLENCTNNPYSRPEQTAAYVVSWVAGAQSAWGQEINYIGSWVRCRACRLACTSSLHNRTTHAPIPCRMSAAMTRRT